jgi:hypothetical protein
LKLVTYRRGESAPRAGALIDDGATIVDLSTASEYADAHSVADPRFNSVLTMIEGGDAALERAHELVSKAPSSARVPHVEATLDAPVQPPVQMRDCLCFEGHLVQAFRNARMLRAQQFPDPEAKFTEMEREGILSVPKTFYEQPIYYKANRLAVIGTDRDVHWPSYSNSATFSTSNWSSDFSLVKRRLMFPRTGRVVISTDTRSSTM